jgi:hypothetical protein
MFKKIKVCKNQNIAVLYCREDVQCFAGLVLNILSGTGQFFDIGIS